MAHESSSSLRIELAVLVALAAAAIYVATRPAHEITVTEVTATPPAVSAPARPTRTPRPMPAAPGSGENLPGAAGEAQAIARAKMALRQGDTRQALALIDDYTARFPSGTLRDDAVVLKVEALLRSGDRLKAAEAAKPLLAGNPSSAQASRARALLASTPSMAPSARTP